MVYPCEKTENTGNSLYAAYLLKYYIIPRAIIDAEKKRITRMLLLQATVKRFQFDHYVNLEGKQILISSWFQK